MIGALRRKWDEFRGSGDAAVTVPPMDGVLRPNQAIEEAALVAGETAPDNLVVSGGVVHFSSGARLMRSEDSGKPAVQVAAYSSPIAAMAARDGTIAIGLETGAILLRAGDGSEREIVGSAAPIRCLTALTFDADGNLLACEGSSKASLSDWKRDLLERRADGVVWKIDLASGRAEKLASGLGWPAGIVALKDGRVAVAESWRHRVITVSAGGKAEPVLSDLPGYPSRLVPAAGEGYWLCVPVPRSQLIELLQREPAYRRAMMNETSPDHWIAPSLRASTTFLEPLQGGALKHLGILKPWAPSCSYGLLIRLAADFAPIASYHSRADGRRHGVTSAVDHASGALVACKGADAIVRLEESTEVA
ncbi:hypothetical protein [Mesorhizobium australicum]|uniref:Strictosidine synthase n=1 Tax=Mesorhizobium australicum TaxID=536018 RepID=A0A1X7N0Q7_9HYPH|nr:hypothetical protein [Mesorhizobium australicum]SMH30819.1 hypothetical protein SAMN02982922_1083 [Mesorhizobium australicum]